MRYLGLALLFIGTAGAVFGALAQAPHYDTPAPTHPAATQLHHNDDVQNSYGNTAAAPDCWHEWDTGAATDNMRLTCTDVDGGGTDGVIWRVETGTDNLWFGDTGQGDMRIGHFGNLNSSYIEVGENPDDFSFFIVGSWRFKISSVEVRVRLPLDVEADIRDDNDGVVSIASGDTFTADVVQTLQSAAAPSEPVACSAANLGHMQYVSDTNDAAAGQLCICHTTDDESTFDWVQVLDMSTACSFF